MRSTTARIADVADTRDAVPLPGPRGLERAEGYGTIYTRKLLRRGIDIEQPGVIARTQPRTAGPPAPGPLTEISPPEGGNRGKQDSQAILAAPACFLMWSPNRAVSSPRSLA
jgi:hypothetical protein